MKVVVAKTAGFCMGVRRAVEMALDAPARHEPPIHTFGPLIHNPQVLGLFAQRGVSIIETIPEKGHGTVLIRAHGVPPVVKQGLKQAGLAVIDATCPRVVKVQSIIKSHARKGYAAIIVGDQDHPEVISLLGFAGDRGQVVGSLQALQDLPPFDHAIVVAQTTQNQAVYRNVKAWVTAHRPHYKIFDTICDSTEKRQTEVLRLAKEVDALVVVGGRNSGNTRRLAEIATHCGKPAFHVETEADLDEDAMAHYAIVGVTAGASTPTWIIKRVVRALEKIPLTYQQGWRSLTLRLERLALLTNTYVALGAGCLCLAATQLQGLSTSMPALSVAMFYVMSMHILNHLTGRAEDQYNDPDRERFYAQHKWLLTGMAVIAGAMGLVAAYRMGVLPFWTLLAMSLMGLSYNVRLIPTGVLPGLKVRRIRDLPGSKTILIALAWGVVTAGLPALASESDRWAGGLVATVWATGLAFARTAYFDLLDIQGDRIVGKETIPILLGPEKAMRLIIAVLLLGLLVLLIAGVWGLFTSLAFALALAPLFLLVVIVLHERGYLTPGLTMDLLVESLFILTGVTSLLYILFQ